MARKISTLIADAQRLAADLELAALITEDRKAPTYENLTLIRDLRQAAAGVAMAICRVQR